MKSCGVLASVCILLGPTVLNADGPREKTRGALTTLYFWNVPKCVLGHFAGGPIRGSPCMDASRDTLVFDGDRRAPRRPCRQPSPWALVFPKPERTRIGVARHEETINPMTRDVCFAWLEAKSGLIATVPKI